VTKVDALQNQLLSLKTQVENIQKQIELALKQPPEPEMYSIVRFKRRFENNSIWYHYAAIRSPKGWFVTGTYQTQFPTWDKLMEWIGVEWWYTIELMQPTTGLSVTP